MPEDIFYLWVHRACKTLFGSPIFVKILVEVNWCKAMGKDLYCWELQGKRGWYKRGWCFCVVVMYFWWRMGRGRRLQRGDCLCQWSLLSDLHWVERRDTSRLQRPWTWMKEELNDVGVDCVGGYWFNPVQVGEIVVRRWQQCFVWQVGECLSCPGEGVRGPCHFFSVEQVKWNEYKQTNY